MVQTAQQYGQESTVMRTRQGSNQREIVQAVVVSADEIANNPAFSALREREGLGEGTSQVSTKKQMYFLTNSSPQ